MYQSRALRISGRIESNRCKNACNCSQKIKFLSVINCWTSLISIKQIKQGSTSFIAVRFIDLQFSANFLEHCWLHGIYFWTVCADVTRLEKVFFFVASLSFESESNIFTEKKWETASGSATCYRSASYLLLRKCNEALWVSINCATSLRLTQNLSRLATW